MDSFTDVYAANVESSASFTDAETPGKAGRGLAVITCMDSRIDPLAMLGLEPGDAKIIRNAGARVTDDVLSNLVVATYLLGVERIMVIPHTDCGMAKNDEAAVQAATASKGVDSRSLTFHTIADPVAQLTGDVQRILSMPQLPVGIPVVGCLYDVTTGLLQDPSASGYVGRPVAVLSPAPHTEADAYQSLVAAGKITPAKRRFVVEEIPPRRPGEVSVDDILQELREDRL